MRSRAAFLPYPGDPFLLHYWLKFFDEVWGEEVDCLYIYLNSPIEKPVVDYIRRLCLARPKINFQYNPVQIEHGTALDRMLDVCTQEYIMFIEDDGFIFKKGLVNKYFELLESGNYDVIGSKRGSCAMEILSRASQVWGIPMEGEGDQGCNFWPNFFFTKKEILLKTDRQFGAKAWHRGDIIKELNDYVIQDETSYGDTFVWGSLQIRHIVPQERILTIPQYHGSPDDLEHYTRSYNLFDGIAGWVHVGSLSSGVGGILQDGRGRCLSRRLLDEDKGENYPIPNYCHTEQEKNEFERRVQWWLRFIQYFHETDLEGTNFSFEMGAFAKLYKKAIDEIISQYGLSMSRIERRQKIYATLGL